MGTIYIYICMSNNFAYIRCKLLFFVFVDYYLTDRFYSFVFQLYASTYLDLQLSFINSNLPALDL